MSYTYQQTPLAHLLHVDRERISAVECDGLPQVPDVVNQFWQLHGHDVEPPPALREQSDKAIAAFMKGHFERRIEKLRNSTFASHSRFRMDDDTDADELD